MANFGKDLIAAMEEAAAHAQGKAEVARVHTIEVPDVRAIRETLGLSQQAFASAYRIPLATLKGVGAGPPSAGCYGQRLSIRDRQPATRGTRGSTRCVNREQIINDTLLAKQPTKSFVQPEDAGALAVFLCRDEARNVDGANRSMDGGWTAE